MSCRGGNCSCGSGCSCNSGRGSCKTYPDLAEKSIVASETMILGVAPPKGHSEGSEMDTGSKTEGCKCNPCKCDPCNC